MSDNGRRYAPKDATPRSQNSREFKLNLSEDQLNHTDELEDLRAMPAAAHHSVWKKALPVHAPPARNAIRKRKRRSTRKETV